MKEAFLHFLWQHKLLHKKELVTTENENIQLLKQGNYNTNTGPDFLNAQLKINNQLWVGNVELHIQSSDWYLHKHEEDENYDAVILHVVWEHDATIFMKNNKPLPTLALKNFVSKELLHKYYQLFSKELRWIACEKQIKDVDTFIVNNWLERLFLERLKNKSTIIQNLLLDANNNYEAVLFQLIAKNFGLKVNGEVFLELAKSFDFAVFRKVSFKEHSLSALMYGQAGFLSEEIENSYYQELKKEYKYLQHKFQLIPLNRNRFQFFRMRPNNFPTIRIAQLVSLFHTHQNIFSKLITISKLEDFYKLLSVEVNDFWKTHYTFETTSKKSPKKLTKSFIDLVIINTIIPLRFVYEKSRGEVNEEKLLALIKQLKPEKNSIVNKFSVLEIKSKNAFESQALLELKNNFCDQKRCLQCAIGNNLLKTVVN